MNTKARLICLLLAFTPAAFAQNWIAPTPEELSMTSQPEVPGASAVYLNREQIGDDLRHSISIYARIKILTEAGKEQANVEIPFASGYGGLDVVNAEGRTIHPDGTIVPFTGKPFQKEVEKSKDYKVMEKVFTLPAVEVGSIIEYRYKMLYDDRQVRSPDWYIQSELYTRKAHYVWYPTSQLVISHVDGDSVSSSVAWTPILPPGAEVKQIQETGAAKMHIELSVHDIPPTPHEEYMPPVASFTYRVLFYYTSVRTENEYWKNAGKRWSKGHDSFIGPGPVVKAAVQGMVAPNDTSEQKLQKFYAAVMALENTDFTRERSTQENKAAGLREVKTTDDILARKRGSSDQLSDLFVAMARAAGMKAYVMAVANRQRRVFVPSYLTLGQLDDDIAIVTVDGKDKFFDPGSRYCAFGHLAWQHGLASGLRQIDGGTALVTVSNESYLAEHVSRLGDLVMDEHGKVTGTVRLSLTGDAALQWRQVALRGDDASLDRSLREYGESLLPGGMEVTVSTVQNLTRYDLPLEVAYSVSGGVGSPTGKRLLIPCSLFEVNSRPHFPEEKRDLLIDMHHADYIQDAVRIKLPPSLAIESLPAAMDKDFPNSAAYRLSSEKTADSFTIRRSLALAEVLFDPKKYPELRSFYNTLQTKDKESIVLIRVAPGAGAN